MPVINPILTSDTFDQWRQKDNAAITAINNEGINEIVSIIDPLNDQDILVYNASTEFFENVGIEALVTEIIGQLSSISLSNLKPFYMATTFRQIF